MKARRIGGKQRIKWDQDLKITAKSKTKVGFYHISDFRIKAIFNKQQASKRLDWDRIEELRRKEAWQKEINSLKH